MPKCPKCGSTRVQRGYDDTPIHLRLIGFNELLCNNCHTEFRGFSLAGRFERSRARHIYVGGRMPGPGNTSRAIRYGVRIPARVMFIDPNSPSEPKGAGKWNEGFTRNLSLIGLAVVLPDALLTDNEFKSARMRARVDCDLSSRTVRLDTKVVRYEQLEEGLSGWLVGLRIVKVSDEDRVRWSRYLATGK